MFHPTLIVLVVDGVPVVSPAIFERSRCLLTAVGLPRGDFGVVPWYPSLFVGFVGVDSDQRRSEFGSSSVDDDGRDVIVFVSWIGLDRRISFGRSGFGRLDLMLRVAPTHIIEGQSVMTSDSQSRGE